MFLIWCESRKIAGRRSSEFSCVKPVVKSCSGRVTFWNSVKHQRRSSSSKTANGLNTLTASSEELHRRPPFRFRVRIRLEVLQIFFLGGELSVDCGCIELVAASWRTRKWLRLDQTIEAIRNLSSGDSGILLVVIQLGVIRLKKTRSFISSPRLV